MNQETMVSVIIPVYNAEKYLNRCVDSVLKQTYQNLEVLLIDDGSKDGSGAICDEYAAQDCRVRVIHKENTGVSDTRNVGLDEAKGDYILFVDSDDYIAPEMLVQIVRVADKNNSDIAMCEYSIEKKGAIKPMRLNYQAIYSSKQEVKDGLLYRYYTDDHVGLYCLWNKLFKRKIITDNKITFDTTLKRGEDAWFIFQCLKFCSRVDYISEPYYFYYQNEESVMHTTYDDQYEKWVDMRKRLLQENDDLKFIIDRSLFYKEFLYKVIIYCRDAIKAEKKEVVRNIFRDNFFQKAAKHTSLLPLHVRFIAKLVEMKMFNTAAFVCTIWAGCERGNYVK